MINNHRPSILHRPKFKEGSRHNEENGVVEYEREQEKWRVKAARHADAEDRLRRSLYAMPEDIQRNAQELTATIQQQQHEKAAIQAAQAAADAAWEQPPAWKCIPGKERPWTIASQFVQEQESEEARREHLRRIAEDNRRSMAQRAHQQWALEQQEREQASRQTAAEDTFWNYGAASEKWIPPERRVKPQSDYSRMEHTHPVPYQWDPAPLPARPQTAQATVPAWQQQPEPVKHAAAPTNKLPAREFPWTWHGAQ